MKCWDCNYWDEETETCTRSECVEDEEQYTEAEKRFWNEFDEGMGR